MTVRGVRFGAIGLAIELAIALAIGLSFSVPANADSAANAVIHTLYLVRHGSYVADPKADPAVGPSLTPLGVAQARLIGARLRGMPVHFDSMTSSGMTRAKETAAVMHEILSDVPLTASTTLNECTPPIADSNPDEKACATRLDGFFADHFKPAKPGAQNEVIVAHGNVIRYLVTKALGVDTRSWIHMTIAHTSLTVIRVTPSGQMSVEAVGDTGHIPPNLVSFGTPADPQLIAHD